MLTMDRSDNAENTLNVELTRTTVSVLDRHVHS